MIVFSVTTRPKWAQVPYGTPFRWDYAKWLMVKITWQKWLSCPCKVTATYLKQNCGSGTDGSIHLNLTKNKTKQKQQQQKSSMLCTVDARSKEIEFKTKRHLVFIEFQTHFFSEIRVRSIEVRKTTKIRKRYNQVPHLMWSLFSYGAYVG